MYVVGDDRGSHLPEHRTVRGAQQAERGVRRAGEDPFLSSGRRTADGEPPPLIRRSGRQLDEQVRWWLDGIDRRHQHRHFGALRMPDIEPPALGRHGAVPRGADRNLDAGRDAVLAGETAHRVQCRGGGQAGVADRERRVGPPRVAARRAQPPRPERLVDLRGPGVRTQLFQPDDRGERGAAGRRGRHGPHRDHGRAFDAHRPSPRLHDDGAGALHGQLADGVGEERPAAALPDAVPQRHPGAHQLIRDLHAPIVRPAYDGFHTRPASRRVQSARHTVWEFLFARVEDHP
jgi:hypothetical protein